MAQLMASQALPVSFWFWHDPHGRIGMALTDGLVVLPFDALWVALLPQPAIATANIIAAICGVVTLGPRAKFII